MRRFRMIEEYVAIEGFFCVVFGVLYQVEDPSLQLMYALVIHVLG